MSDKPVNKHPLDSLRQFTAARIAMGRAGNSVPIKQSMEFNLAHAHARDAVYSVLDIDGLCGKLKIFDVPLYHLHSQAATRHKYLKRPDLGRKLDDASKEQLVPGKTADIAIIIADGLS